ncbi:hypothetical protein GWI33_015516 [Rhynchophorus ferrugineus]|uniref:Ig-like domain-containing protein n=1 Tax=Rhynchophorus ferrugineus TaxID=354439 RepID=A0A834I0N9_RHYFE|nr:hypothetical protein GWI33_015516 [Rhynchophorus ferrugineus]
MRLNVPRAVRTGHSVTLSCEYDLEGAPLYSVKWYREGYEFYRYVPKEEPPTRVFTQQGLHVDVSVSNAHNVTLLSVGRDISGQFQCEVSADAPLFHTQLMSAPMTVADLVHVCREQRRAGQRDTIVNAPIVFRDYYIAFAIVSHGYNFYFSRYLYI